jgi:acyl CoA:acetate/3-ketoacid CoA transferase beta subunit
LPLSPRKREENRANGEVYCAGQGRIDAFFLSGAQIDGRANINLVSIGDPGRPKARFPGSFGSGYLYYVVPRVILFREDTPRFVEKVLPSARGQAPRASTAAAARTPC